MNIKKLYSTSKSRANMYRAKSIAELKYYMEGYETNYSLWSKLSRVLNDLIDDSYLSVMGHVHDIISDGYYVDDVLSDYKEVKKIYLHILRYVTYRILQNDADCGIDNLTRHEKWNINRGGSI